MNRRSTGVNPDAVSYTHLKVAFGTLVQLVLEDAAIEELEEVLDFCMSVGLPTTLADLGIEQVEPEKIMEVARLACADTDTLHNMPFEVNADKMCIRDRLTLRAIICLEGFCCR